MPRSRYLIFIKYLELSEDDSQLNPGPKHGIHAGVDVELDVEQELLVLGHNRQMQVYASSIRG
jgi:hypothetical protein